LQKLYTENAAKITTSYHKLSVEHRFRHSTININNIQALRVRLRDTRGI